MNGYLEALHSGFFKDGLFYMVLSVGSYQLGVQLKSVCKSQLINPLMVATIACIAVLKLTGRSYAEYAAGGTYIGMFLPPATAVLALSVYRQREVLRANIFPVLSASVAGFAASAVSVYGLCRLFRLDKVLTVSLLPKSVTAAIAMPLAERAGGVPSLTMFGVLLTGIIGAVFSPMFIKVLRIQNPVIAGLAIGTSSHALGTTTALQLGETEGAMSGIALCIAGLAAAIMFMFI